MAIHEEVHAVFDSFPSQLSCTHFISKWLTSITKSPCSLQRYPAWPLWRVILGMSSSRFSSRTIRYVYFSGLSSPELLGLSQSPSNAVGQYSGIPLRYFEGCQEAGKVRVQTSAAAAGDER